MLRSNRDLIDKSQQLIDEYKYMASDKIIGEILERWKNEQLEFNPDIDIYPQITTYSGEIRLESLGKKYSLKINLVK